MTTDASLAEMRAACQWRMEAIAGHWGGGVGVDPPMPPIGTPERSRMDAAQKAMVEGLLKVAAPGWTNAKRGAR